MKAQSEKIRSINLDTVMVGPSLQIREQVESAKNGRNCSCSTNTWWQNKPFTKTGNLEKLL